MKKRLMIPFVLVLASGLRAEPLATSIVEALTPIDALPTTTALDAAFQPMDTVTQLQAIALAPTTCSATDPIDFGVQLRAIRALPSYCPSPCGVEHAPDPDTTVHATLVQLLQTYTTIPVPAPCDVLRVRAAIEALGLAGVNAGLTSDADRIEGFLDNTNRDVRATAAKALGTLCNTSAKDRLTVRFVAEPSAQVRLAISAALRALTGTCPGAAM